jgi:hypothetical protein
VDSVQFTYLFKGFFELSENTTLSEKQVIIIKDHLDLVFNKVTPDRSKEIQIKEDSKPSDCIERMLEDIKKYKDQHSYIDGNSLPKPYLDEIKNISIWGHSISDPNLDTKLNY